MCRSSLQALFLSWSTPATHGYICSSLLQCTGRRGFTVKDDGKVVIAIVILVLSTVGHPTGLNCTFRLGYLPLLSTLDMRRATAEKAAGVLVA